jgi:hypothetical protein
VRTVEALRSRQSAITELTESAGRPHALHMHLQLSDRANKTFPLEPYIQSPDVAFDSKVKPGTLVVPVHPEQVHDRFLHRTSPVLGQRLC